MTTMHRHSTVRPRRGSEPAVGRPVLFALMLGLAALGVLALLLAGPSIPMPSSVASAAGLMGLVALAWAVAGPRI